MVPPVIWPARRCADWQMTISFQLLQRVVQEVVDQILALPQGIACQRRPDRTCTTQRLAASENPDFPVARGSQDLRVQCGVSIARPAREAALRRFGAPPPTCRVPDLDVNCAGFIPPPPLRLVSTVKAHNSTILDFSQGAGGSRSASENDFFRETRTCILGGTQGNETHSRGISQFRP